MGRLASDTDGPAEEAQIAVLRILPAWRKLELLGDACDTNRALMLAGLRSRFPDLSEAELHSKLMELLVGKDLAERIWGPNRTDASMSTSIPPSLSVVLEVVGILEDLGIPYHLGGSFASAVHGVPRQTMDADLVVDLSAGHVDRLIGRLAIDF